MEIGKEVLMIKMKSCFILILFFFSFEISGQDCTEIFLIRHAEKIRSNPSEKDPELNAEGKLRASKWAEIFQNIQFDEIYSTKYKRTFQTVKPISSNTNTAVKFYSAAKINYENFLKKNIGKKILVVGHSNTIPNFVNNIIGKKIYKQMDDNNNSNLYIVNLCLNSISHKLLLIK